MYTRGTGPLVCGPGYEYYLIEERVRRCAARVDELTGRIQQIQAIEWQSPAGRAFRHSLQEHRHSMTELHENISQAAVSVRRLAEAVSVQELANRSGVGA